MLTFRKVAALELLFAAVSLVVMGIIAAQLPERVPIHWDLSGKADGFGSRGSLIALTSILAVLPFLLTVIIPRLPSRSKRLTSNDHSFLGMMLVISAFFCALGIGIMYSASNPVSAPVGVTFALVGLMFAGLGWFMRDIKPNYYAGIRTPWSLSSDQVWRETHRRGGVIFMISGVLMAVFAFALPIASVAVMLIGCFYPIYDSYRIFKAVKSP